MWCHHFTSNTHQEYCALCTCPHDIFLVARATNGGRTITIQKCLHMYPAHVHHGSLQVTWVKTVGQDQETWPSEGLSSRKWMDGQRTEDIASKSRVKLDFQFERCKGRDDQHSTPNPWCQVHEWSTSHAWSTGHSDGYIKLVSNAIILLTVFLNLSYSDVLSEWFPVK